MHISTVALVLYTVFSFDPTLAAPAPNPDDHSLPTLPLDTPPDAPLDSLATDLNFIFDGPHPIDYTLTAGQQPTSPPDTSTPASILTAQSPTCYTGSAIWVPDVDSLTTFLQTNTEFRYVPAGSWVSWTSGSARVCVYNNYIGDANGLWVRNSEMGWADSVVKDRCCAGSSWCGGGWQLGDSWTAGYYVSIALIFSGSSC